jgi:hypothetical protein
MGCGCKKRSVQETPQEAPTQQTPSVTPTAVQTTDEMVKITTILREMVNKKNG